ncbi:MAG: MdtA/MuxA family multidrug efflux RND transporter periplasmic adaptor subunit [Magnetococcales bacterium]|nr:MdtA/MuxA family multidrug efflux RND transporter periplasmic adaptor subunit [Magnetococcales bacterium]
MSDAVRKPGWQRWLGWLMVLLVVAWGGVRWLGLDPLVLGSTLLGAKGDKEEQTDKGGKTDPADKTAKTDKDGKNKGWHKGGGKPIPVLTSVVTPGPVRVRLEALGTVIPAQLVTVRARVDGQLQRVVFREGELVQSGQLLAEIDPRPFEIQLAQVSGQLERDRALLENARRDAARYQTLLRQDAISRQQADTQEALVRQYQGTVSVDQAQVDNAALQLSYTRITAPMTGITGLRQVDAGNMVRQSDPTGLVTLAQVHPIQVLFTMPEEGLPRLLAHWQPGKTLPVELHDRERKNLLTTGKLLTLDNQIDTSTGTVKLKAQFNNAEGRLFPNQFVNVTVILNELPTALLIPGAAIQRGSKGLYVYQVQEDQTVTVRPVEIGPAQGEMTAIDSGLKAGDKVVVDGIDKLQNGTKIQEVTRERSGQKESKDNRDNNDPKENREGRGEGAGQGHKGKGRPADDPRENRAGGGEGAGNKGKGRPADKGADPQKNQAPGG